MRRYKPTTLIAKKLQRRRLANNVTVVNVSKPQRKVANPLKSDPTRSATIRRLFLAQIKRKFKALKRQINQLVIEEDAFGLREEEFNPFRLDSTLNVFCPTGEGGGVDPTCSPSTVKLTNDEVKLLSEWREHLWNRGAITKLAKDTIDGGRLEKLHPGPIKVYRGRPKGSKSTSEVKGTSWTKSRKVAEKWAEGGKVEELQLSKSIPALDINKALRDVPSKSEHEHEVFVVRVSSVITNILTINAGRWRYESDPRKIELFRLWLMRQVEAQVLGDEKITTDDWWDAYIEQAYEKGESRSYDDVKKPGKLGGDKQKLDFYNGTKKEFLQSSFNRPVHRDKVKILAGRVFTDLKNVTEDMSAKITRSLTDGLIQGLNPRDIAKRMDEAVGIGITRANIIARTEITRAHAEGQLDAMVRLGVTEVGFAVEWSTAGDERVCPLCEPLEGIVLKIEEARGLIPRHPQCRCALLPSGVVDDEELVREKKEIEEAIKDSIMAESPKRNKRTYAEQKERTSWGGASTKISKSRPKFLIEDDE